MLMTSGASPIGIPRTNPYRGTIHAPFLPRFRRRGLPPWLRLCHGPRQVRQAPLPLRLWLRPELRLHPGSLLWLQLRIDASLIPSQGPPAAPAVPRLATQRLATQRPATQRPDLVGYHCRYHCSAKKCSIKLQREEKICWGAIWWRSIGCGSLGGAKKNVLAVVFRPIQPVPLQHQAQLDDLLDPAQAIHKRCRRTPGRGHGWQAHGHRGAWAGLKRAGADRQPAGRSHSPEAHDPGTRGPGARGPGADKPEKSATEPGFDESEPIKPGDQT